MVQGFNQGPMGANDNNLFMFLLLSMLCPGMFGGMNGNSILPLILLMSCCGSPC